MPKGVYEREKIHLPKQKTLAEAPPLANPCKEFLQSFLSGGAIIRRNVYRESENANLMWEDVRQAFQELNGREYVQRGEYFWRLTGE